MGNIPNTTKDGFLFVYNDEWAQSSKYIIDGNKLIIFNPEGSSSDRDFYNFGGRVFTKQ